MSGVTCSKLAAKFLLLISFFVTNVMAGKVTNPSRVPKNAVLLSKVSSLTFYRGKSTASRRIDAAPQLECVGPDDVCKLYSVDVMRCVNEGADYDAENIQWSCKASLPEEFKLGSTDVICEGYESSDDPYVLKGSCGVEYRLLLTDKGEEKYGAYIDRQYRSSEHASDTSRWPGILFFVIFVAVLAIIIRGLWSSWNQSPPHAGGSRRQDRHQNQYRPLGSNNGNDDDDNDGDDDPPPPYDGPPLRNSQPRSKKTASTASNTAMRNPSSTQTNPARSPLQGWRPGFWTGAAAGTAAGYLAGNRSQRQEPRHTNPSQQPETQQRPGGFFSNFVAPQQRAQTPAAPPSQPAQSSFLSSPPTYSSTRHESTGFGSTRRR